MIAYNQRIVETSQSRQRRYRAARMLVNLRPELVRLEEAERLSRIERSAPPASSFDGRLQRAKDDGEFEVVWSGRDPLIDWPDNGVGESSLSGRTFGVQK